jgi:hypothetical protein
MRGVHAIGGIMTDTVAPVRTIVRAESKYFYFHMMCVCAAVAFLGFLPTYWMPMATGTLNKAPVAHIHGIIYFAWSLYIVFQSWLGATGQYARHRAVGLIGVSLATAMFIFGFLVVMQFMAENKAAGQPEVGVGIAAVALTNVGLFAVLVSAALVNIRRPEWHKRLMLMAAISILGAPIARWFIVYLNMYPPRDAVADWLVVGLAMVPLLQDWRTRGKPHNAYWIAFTAIVAVRLVRGPLIESQAWHSVTGWIAGLAG